MNVPEGGVAVIERALGRLEGKLDLIVTNMSESTKNMDSHERHDETRFEEINKRLLRLELRVYGFIGGLLVLQFVSPYLMKAAGH